MRATSPGRLNRTGRLRRQPHRLLEPGHHFRNPTFQLWIASFDLRLWIVIYFDVRINSVTFDDPLAINVSQTRAGHKDRTTIDERPAILNTNHAAPRSLAD